MTDGEAELIRLEAGRARLEIWPERGGSITRYWWQGESGALDWLRPNSRLSADPLAMGCFPLVPFSGRIREGRFDVAGRRIALPLNFLPERHAIHGHGWQAPWTLVQRSAHAATIEYRHRPDAWPMAYLARQTFTLGEAALELEIEVTNLADVAMPAGLGFHPYFPRTPGARVSAKVAAMWESDQEVMPTRLIAPPPERDLTAGVVAEAAALDNIYTGWDGRAVIAWPERDAGLVITADPPVDFLIVFTPPGADFFCVEPVSTCADAFNLQAAGREDSGTRILAPGESLSARARLHPQL